MDSQQICRESLSIFIAGCGALDGRRRCGGVLIHFATLTSWPSLHTLGDMKFACRYSAKMQSIYLYFCAELTMIPVHFIFSTSIYACSHFAPRSQIGNIATR